MVEAGHWFLKHRKNGETPHRRFVFARGDSIFWSTREDRGGKLGQMDGPGLMVVPGAATVIFANKKRMHEARRNRVFSVVGAARSLDLEAESEAERHQWVRALNAFTKRSDAIAADPITSSAAATGLLGPTMDDLSALGVGVGAALGVAPVDVSALDGAEAAHARLAHHDSTEMHGAVSFPRMRATMSVQTGDLRGRWERWELELDEGELSCAGRGCLPLRHVAALGLTCEEPSGELASDCGDQMGMSGPSASDLEGELRLRLKMGGAEGRSAGAASLGLGALATSGGKGDSSAAAPDLRMRAPVPIARAWHVALSRSMALVEDIELVREGTRELWKAPPPPQLLPLRKETLEIELNRLFEGAFEACAGEPRGAIEAFEPLMQACTTKLHTAANTLPPRSDIFVYLAEGLHRRFCNIYQVLLVRFDLDRSYLDTQGQAAPPLVGHTEVLEPALMLALIGWARRYEERMGRVGAGVGRQLLTPEANESVISAYLHACRQLTRQWATNIVFCEEQTMLRKESEAALLAVRERGGAGGGEGGGGGARELTQGIITMSDEGGQQLWFTELHLDLFRIVHEHVELGIGTGIEVVLFNVLLASADFLVDVQNDLLAKCRKQWRSLGFVYLCALVNNCRRCAELWDKVLQTCRERDDSPLSEALAANLHMGFVVDGFVNLGFAAMQLAARRVLVQIERPLAMLFAGGSTRHHPNEMAALVDHFLQMVRDGVAGSHATRTCAIVLEQLLLAYGTMLFVPDAPLTCNTPDTISADLAVFERLLNTHCDSGVFASRHKAATRVRAAALLQLLCSLQELLTEILTPAATSAAVDVDEVSALVTQLMAQQPALTRELLTRIFGRCKGVKAVLGRKGAALLEQAELAARRDLTPHAATNRASVRHDGDGASPGAGLGEASSSAEAGAADAKRVCSLFFQTATAAVALGKKGFSVGRLIENLGSARRWE